MSAAALTVIVGLGIINRIERNNNQETEKISDKHNDYDDFKRQIEKEVEEENKKTQKEMEKANKIIYYRTLLDSFFNKSIKEDNDNQCDYSIVGFEEEVNEEDFQYKFR